jgi:hypothetical protein
MGDVQAGDREKVKEELNYAFDRAEARARRANEVTMLGSPSMKRSSRFTQAPLGSWRFARAATSSALVGWKLECQARRLRVVPRPPIQSAKRALRRTRFPLIERHARPGMPPLEPRFRRL